jgi:hypothetical protein
MTPYIVLAANQFHCVDSRICISTPIPRKIAIQSAAVANPKIGRDRVFALARKAV